jgi:hypothetical protein
MTHIHYCPYFFIVLVLKLKEAMRKKKKLRGKDFKEK